MNRPTRRADARALTLGTLVGLAVASVVAWRLGGAEGTGVLAGYLTASCLSALGVAWQVHLLRTRPAQVMSAVVGAFLAKLAVVLLGAVVFRFVEPAGRHVEWRSFLVAFAAGALVVVAAGSLEALWTLRRGMKEERSAA